MRKLFSMNGLLVVGMVAVCCGVVAPAGADAQPPDVVFGVIDTNFDGTPDEFSSASLADAIFTRFKDQRSFAEFDLSGLGGPVIQSATITGVLNEQFTFGFGTSPADFVFDLYEGNGVADLSDFNIAGTTVGTVTLDEDFDVYNVSFDVTDALQGIVDAGGTFAGLRSMTIDSNVGQVDINDLMLDVVAVPEPGTLSLLAVGGLLLAGRRRG